MQRILAGRGSYHHLSRFYLSMLREYITETLLDLAFSSTETELPDSRQVVLLISIMWNFRAET